MLNDRMLYISPVAWLQQTEYASNSCSIPLDPRYSKSGQMPFTSTSLVVDKTLGVHLDRNNMKGSITFVSIPPSVTLPQMVHVLQKIDLILSQVYVLLAQEYRSRDKVPQGHILARYRFFERWLTGEHTPTSDLIQREGNFDSG
jgi:hypothetical protein